MDNFESFEQKSFEDSKKKKNIKVSGKSVFLLKKMGEKSPVKKKKT